MYKGLIVDDEQNILNSMKRLFRLKKSEFEFDFALGGKHAVEYLNKNDYDFLITDMNMPGMSGLELAEYAKNINQALKVIILSGNTIPDILNNPNVDNALSKPCDVDELVSTVKVTIT
jgi:YesN/AraC family two-component response regulator